MSQHYRRRLYKGKVPRKKINIGDYPYKIHINEDVTYVIEGVGTGLVKIGKTIQIQSRLGALRAGSACNLKVLRIIKGCHHEDVLHRNLKQFRKHGEWFRKTPELIEYLNRYHRSDPYFLPIWQESS